MTRREKEYLLKWIHNAHNRLEVEFDEKLYFFNKHNVSINFDISFLELEKAYFQRNAYFRMCCELSELLKCSFFDDTTKYKNSCAKFFNGLTLTQQQDDLIRSFALGLIYNKKFSNFDDVNSKLLEDSENV